MCLYRAKHNTLVRRKREKKEKYGRTGAERLNESYVSRVEVEEKVRSLRSHTAQNLNLHILNYSSELNLSYMNLISGQFPFVVSLAVRTWCQRN